MAIALALLCLVAFPAAAIAALQAPDLASILVVATCAEVDAGVLPPEPICEVLTVEDDEGFFAAAPICDPSGASAVAPQPISPIGDDRIEQTPGCDDQASALQLGPRPSGDDSPHHQISVGFEPALVPEQLTPLRHWGVVSLAPFGRLLGPAEGVARAVEHPPHAA